MFMITVPQTIKLALLEMNWTFSWFLFTGTLGYEWIISTISFVLEFDGCSSSGGGIGGCGQRASNTSLNSIGSTRSNNDNPPFSFNIGSYEEDNFINRLHSFSMSKPCFTVFGFLPEVGVIPLEQEIALDALYWYWGIMPIFPNIPWKKLLLFFTLLWLTDDHVFAFSCCS